MKQIQKGMRNMGRVLPVFSLITIVNVASAEEINHTETLVAAPYIDETRFELFLSKDFGKNVNCNIFSPNELNYETGSKFHMARGQCTLQNNHMGIGAFFSNTVVNQNAFINSGLTLMLQNSTDNSLTKGDFRYDFKEDRFDTYIFHREGKFFADILSVINKHQTGFLRFGIDYKINDNLSIGPETRWQINEGQFDSEGIGIRIRYQF